MASIDYRGLRGWLRILDLLNRMGWRATECRGEQFRDPCPFCSLPGGESERRSVGDSPAPSRSASRLRHFSVHRARHLYRCFRCGSAGNALDLRSTFRQLPLHAAALELLADLDHTVTCSHDSPDQATSEH